MNGQKTMSASVLAASAGAIGGFAFWVLLLFFIFAYPDAQGGIALMFSPFYSATFGVLLCIAVWGAVSSSRGKRWAILLAIPAVLLMLLFFLLNIVVWSPE